MHIMYVRMYAYETSPRSSKDARVSRATAQSAVIRVLAGILRSRCSGRHTDGPGALRPPVRACASASAPHGQGAHPPRTQAPPCLPWSAEFVHDIVLMRCLVVVRRYIDNLIVFIARLSQQLRSAKYNCVGPQHPKGRTISAFFMANVSRAHPEVSPSSPGGKQPQCDGCRGGPAQLATALC